MKPIEIYRMKDKNESHHKKKGLLFDLPFKVACVGKSFLAGKSNLCLNLLAREDPRMYKNDFLAENIYIFSPSADGSDFKLKQYIELMDIPSSNIFLTYDEAEITALYEILQENYNEAIENGEKPPMSLFYFDDMTFGGQLKKKMNGIISKIMCNGRHILLSVLITSQMYVDLPRVVRENLTGLMLFSGTDRQLSIVEEEHNFFENKKDFRKMYREVSKDPHSFLVVNYSNPIETRYMNSNFLPVGKCGKPLNGGCKCK